MKMQYLITCFICSVAGLCDESPSFAERVQEAKSFQENDRARYCREVGDALVYGIDMLAKNELRFDELGPVFAEFLFSTNSIGSLESDQQGLAVRSAFLEKLAAIKIPINNAPRADYVAARKLVAVSCIRFCARVQALTQVTDVESSVRELAAAKKALQELPLSERKEMFEDFGSNAGFENFKSESLKAALKRMRSAEHRQIYAEALQRDAIKTWPQLAKLAGDWLSDLYRSAPAAQAELDALLKEFGQETGLLADAVHAK
jgi:hypothetical protein